MVWCSPILRPIRFLAFSSSPLALTKDLRWDFVRCSTWLNSKPWTLPDPKSGKQFKIVLPWDGTVQSVILASRGLGVNTLPVAWYVAMGSLGDRIESFITENSADTKSDVEIHPEKVE